MPMIEVQALTHVGMFTDDIEACRKFYTEELGFEVYREVEQETMHIIYLQNGDVRLEFLSLGKMPEHGPIHHFALDIKGDLVAFIDHLKEIGMDIPGEVGIYPQPNGVIKKMIFIKGPAGENIEFFEYIYPEENK